MPSMISGLADTESVLSDERAIDMSAQVAMLDPDVDQFYTMLTKLPVKEAVREKILWLEDELRPRLSALAASATSAATTIDVTTGHGVYFRAKDLVRNASTGEAMLITSISTDTVTVTRAIGGVAAASSASGAELLIVSNAQAQGATLPTRKITKKAVAYNYTQIQRDPWGFTRTENNIENYYAGSASDYEQVKKLQEHKRAIETTLFWGARSFTSSAPNSLGTCGGLIEYIPSGNIFNPAGAMTAATFDGYLRTALRYNQDPVIFCSPLFASVLSGYLRSATAPATFGGRKYGSKVDSVISGAYGTEIPIVVKKDWGDFGTSTLGYGSWAFIVDMSAVRFRPLRNSNTMLLRNRQANDADELSHEYLTEFSLEVRVPSRHALIKNATS